MQHVEIASKMEFRIFQNCSISDRISYLKVSTTESLDDGVELDGFEDDCNEDRPYEPTWTDIYSFQERTDKVRNKLTSCNYCM